jgi:putative ABC transport system permease protein
MLKNYLKIAWKVLLRRKFFTFISLFGISFTLMILMVATALLDHVTGPVTPETRLDRMLFINFIKMKGKDGNMTVLPSYHYLDTYVRKMKTPEKMAFSSGMKAVNTYVNNKRLDLDLKYTDAAFWEILEFRFLEGKAFNQQDVANASRVAVISKNTSTQYFGEGVSAVGKYIEVNNQKFRVGGVVEDVPISRLNSYANIWVPLTTTADNLKNPALSGEYMAILLAPTAADIPKLKAEYEYITKQVKLPDPKRFDKFSSNADGILEGVVRTVLGDESNNRMGVFYAILAAVIILFMLMPTINLVNINVSRILERSSEIGVRKAFGASSQTLIGQFLVENVFLTLLGGAFGFILSEIVLLIISDSGLIPHARLGLNFRVFGIGIGLSLLFGLISGVFPAYKMSRLQAVEALKGGTL